jgi:predicted nucleotidyltransferase
MDIRDIIATLRRHEAELHRQGVTHAALFGSTARGDASPHSDIDILIDLDPQECSYEMIIEAAQLVKRKLDELADVVLDTGVPPGDAAFEVEGMRTAPLSSLTSVFLWNLVLARLVEHATRDGVALPLWTSANVEGGDERNAELLSQYRPVIPLL